jgi:hypothetical protein
VNGSAKAWTVFTGTGTAAIDDSLNTSSLTDNGTGDYTLDWSNSFASTRYGVGELQAIVMVTLELAEH